MIPEHDIGEIKSYVNDTINIIPGFDVEYYDIVDDAELIPVAEKSEMNPGRRYFGCIAVKAGSIRLIDNVEIRLVWLKRLFTFAELKYQQERSDGYRSSEIKNTYGLHNGGEP